MSPQNTIAIRNRLFYRLKPLIPRAVQLWLRGNQARRRLKSYAHIWPILEEAGQPPGGWPGWPAQKEFAVALMHDVETDRGQQKCQQLMNLEQEMHVCSSCNFVPERYYVRPEVRHMLTENGFEVGVHGLNHDGRLFESRKIFQERAEKINTYIKSWDAVGFCSPASHHNLAWTHQLNIRYDSSTFDTDPFEPQPDGVQTVFPFFVPDPATHKGYVELPYTLPQDFTLFILLKEKNIEIWKRKLDWIAQKGGLALLITHPDYMAFQGHQLAVDEYPVDNYLQFLDYLKTTYEGRYWFALPRQVASFCETHTKVVQDHPQVWAG